MKANVNPFGLALFLIYLILYGGFVFVTAFFPDAMRWKPFGEINLAIVYGIGLIVAAFVLAIIYGIFGKPTNGGTDRQEKVQ